MSKGNFTRRSALRTIGLTLAGTALPAVSVDATSTESQANNSKSDNLKDFYNAAADRYGKREARISTNIVEENIEKKRAQDWGSEYTNEQIIDDILSHPGIENGSEDIREFQRDIENHQNQTKESDTTGVRSVSISPKSQDRLYPQFKRTKRYATYNCRAECAGDIHKDKLWAVSNASVFGNGYAWTRLYARHRAGQTRSHDVTCRYYRQGWVRNSDASIYLYIKEDGKGPKRKRVEKINSGVSSRTLRTRSFDLESGKAYDIGIELYTRAASGGDPLAVSDFYNTTANNGRRHVRVIDMFID